MTIVRTAPDRPATTTLPFSEVTLSAVRIVVGFLFACHGAQKLFGLFGKSAVSFGTWPGWWAGVIELVAGALIMLGLFTRTAAILCSGAMAYAYFTSHQPDGVLPLQNKGELAALYSWVFLMIAVVGPGALSLDAMRRRRRAEAAP